VTTRFSCPFCRTSYRLEVKVLPFYCSCGKRLDEITYAEPAPILSRAERRSAVKVATPDLPCMYRGQPLREINCGCSGKPKIYECSKHGEAYLRKLPKMTKEMVAGCTMCLDCDDRRHFPDAKIGFLLQVFNQSGGMETWAKILIEEVLGKSYSGIYATKSNCTDSSLRICLDLESQASLVDASEIVLVWGQIPNLQAIIQEFPDKKFLAVHHGSLLSTWAQQAFGEALPFCHGGIAVNEDVARHWNVTYLPNPIADSGVRSIGSTDGKVRILWNHRWSIEKQPELMMQIAEALPAEYEVFVSAPRGTKLPSNCVNIGQHPSNVNHLKSADIFLSTANQEAFGYSMAEAALARVPVVCGPFGIGPSIAAQIVESSDPSDWVTAITEVDRSGCEQVAQWVMQHHGQAAINAWRAFLGIE
jgi:hypothetical protein